MHTYWVWPDGFFVHQDEVDDWTFVGRSDDYAVVYVADWVDPDEAEEWFGSAMFPLDAQPDGVFFPSELRDRHPGASANGDVDQVWLD